MAFYHGFSIVFPWFYHGLPLSMVPSSLPGFMELPPRSDLWPLGYWYIAWRVLMENARGCNIPMT